jgi:hypothetical protein
MGPEPIIDENPWLVARSRFRPRIKHVLYPVQANFGVGISSFRTRVVPTRGLVGGPSTSMSGSWPDNEWVKESPVGRDTCCGPPPNSFRSSTGLAATATGLKF